MLFKRLFFRLLVFLSLAVPLYFVVGAMQYAQKSWELKRIGLTTTGSVIKSESYLVEDDDGDYYVYYYTVVYEDQFMKSHTRRLDRSQALYDEGEEINLIFHPKDPKNVQMYRPNHLLWSPIWNFLGTVILWIVLMAFWYQGLYSQIAEPYLDY